LTSNDLYKFVEEYLGNVILSSDANTVEKLDEFVGASAKKKKK